MLADVWRRLGDRVGFFTQETMDKIPDASGTYAWFLPLYIYSNDVEKLVETVRSFYLYDARSGGPATVEALLEYNWNLCKVRGTIERSKHLPKKTIETWGKTMCYEDSRAKVKTALMEASILMPPLYVGKANALRDRYMQHINYGKETVCFKNRFELYADKCGLNIGIEDLIFVCVETPSVACSQAGIQSINEMVEQVLMHICAPPFSCK